MKAVEAIGLTKRFGAHMAVDHLNMTIEQGELFALLGVNGAGKTTTIRMLSCLLAPDAGDALLLGDSITENSRAVRQKINVSPQETAVAGRLTVRENLELIAQLYGCAKSEARSRTDEMIEAFSLGSKADSRARTLSGGMQRRLSIAMALITRPKILFLDEPTLGLDVLARRELWNQICALKGRVTILLTTHYMEEAGALADRIAVMAGGALRAVGTAEELIRSTGCDTLEDAFIRLAGEEARA